MPGTTQLSETSKAIANYLIAHGTTPLKDSPDNFYYCKRELPDGRTLEVRFWDVNKAGVENPMPNSSLDVSLRPVRADQIGYQTTENGLTGAFDDVTILAGIADGALNMSFLFSTRAVNDFTRGQIQKQYERLMKQVYSALSGN